MNLDFHKLLLNALKAVCFSVFVVKFYQKMIHHTFRYTTKFKQALINKTICFVIIILFYTLHFEKTINWVHDQYVPTSPLSFGEGACEA
jgi:hypothetical protein